MLNGFYGAFLNTDCFQNRNDPLCKTIPTTGVYSRLFREGNRGWMPTSSKQKQQSKAVGTCRMWLIEQEILSKLEDMIWSGLCAAECLAKYIEYIRTTYEYFSNEYTIKKNVICCRSEMISNEFQQVIIWVGYIKSRLQIDFSNLYPSLSEERLLNCKCLMILSRIRSFFEMTMLF